jgi:large subunit ribosomal protein L21
MYAIVRVGGHQEKVAPGERIVIDRIKTEVGGTIELSPLMISVPDGETVTDHEQLKARGAVVGTVVEHVKGDKVDVFQYRQKTGYRRHIGHRQALTVVEIAEIRFGDTSVKAEEAKAEAAEKREAELKAAAERRDAAKKAREEEKAAKRKAAAGKKTAGAASKKAGAKKSPAKKSAAKGAKKSTGKKK